MKQIKVTILNQEGLHARPASIFSKAAMKYKCELKLLKNGGAKEYNPKSIMSVLSVGAVKGDELTIIADGIDEDEALSKLKELISSGLVG